MAKKDLFPYYDELLRAVLSDALYLTKMKRFHNPSHTEKVLIHFEFEELLFLIKDELRELRVHLMDLKGEFDYL